VDEDEDAASQFELVMPFVVVASKGGPYDDEAFVAGWSCAEIDQALNAVAPWRATFQRTVRTEVVPQVDLIAMKHEYTLTHDDPDVDLERNDGWTMVTLSPMDPD
jgi:hypothetical protein